MEDTAQGITYQFTKENDEREYGGAVSCLYGSILGEAVAAAAAEAFYKSSFAFRVDAKALCTFLRSCPLSLTVVPGKYIARLFGWMKIRSSLEMEDMDRLYSRQIGSTWNRASATIELQDQATGLSLCDNVGEPF